MEGGREGGKGVGGGGDEGRRDLYMQSCILMRVCVQHILLPELKPGLLFG